MNELRIDKMLQVKLNADSEMEKRSNRMMMDWMEEEFLILGSLVEANERTNRRTNK